MKILHVISSVNPKDGGPIEGIKQDFKYSNHHKIDIEILCSDNKDSPWLKDRRLPKVHALGPKILGYAFNLKLVNWLDINIKKYDAIIVTVSHEQFKKYTSDDYARLSNDDKVVMDIKNIVENPTWRL